jgi:hypothetical protein
MVVVNYFLGVTIDKNVLLFIMNMRNGPFEVDRYDGFEIIDQNWVPDPVIPVPNTPLLLQQQEQPQNKYIKPNNNQPQYQTT